MNSKEIYSTRDLVLATYLKLNGVKLAAGYDVSTKSWNFGDPIRCNELSLDLRNGEAKVQILDYESTRRTLLGMVYDNSGKKF